MYICTYPRICTLKLFRKRIITITTIISEEAENPQQSRQNKYYIYEKLFYFKILFNSLLDYFIGGISVLLILSGGAARYLPVNDYNAAQEIAGTILDDMGYPNKVF